MQLLILFLKQVELVEQLFKSFAENNIKGCTVVDAHGMGEALMDMEELPMFGSLRQLLSEKPKEQTKLLLMAVRDDEVIPATQVIKSVVGDLSKPNTGILITLPIYYCEGLVDQQ